MRIFSVTTELPFAGHPTLGTARAWLDAGGVPRTPGRVVEECGVALVPVRIDDDALAFVAPPLILLGPVVGTDAALEVRAFFNDGGGPLREDPVTGSLNASVAQWLTASGRVKAPYVALQGARVGRDGRVQVTEADGQLWIGGSAVVTVSGQAGV